MSDESGFIISEVVGDYDGDFIVGSAASLEDAEEQCKKIAYDDNSEYLITEVSVFGVHKVFGYSRAYGIEKVSDEVPFKRDDN